MVKPIPDTVPGQPQQNVPLKTQSQPKAQDQQQAQQPLTPTPPAQPTPSAQPTSPAQPTPPKRQQLMMVKRDIRILPPIVLPCGYSLRTYSEEKGEEDGAAWEKIILESFGSRFVFEDHMRKNKAFMPERVFFLCFGSEPVATASAWHRDELGSITGSLHMVGILKSHGGHGLGYWISLAALYRMKEEGKIRSVLRTDDFRLPAVKTYLKLGYEPILVDESQDARWREVFAKIGREDMMGVELLSKAFFDPYAETEDGRYQQ